MKLIKEIVSKDGILHFQRYAIFQSKYFSIYIHKIYKEDNDDHLHNHPWNIATVILRGSYIEELYKPKKNVLSYRKPWRFALRKRKEYHKIKQLLTIKVITLALVFGKRMDWGYIVGNKHVDNVAYRKLKNGE